MHTTVAPATELVQLGAERYAAGTCRDNPSDDSCTCENETVLGRFFALLEALDAEGAADPG